MAYGRKGSGKFRQAHNDMTAKHDKAVAALASQEKGVVTSEQALLNQKLKFENNERARKADLKKLLSHWGVSPGKTLTAERWVAKTLKLEKVTGGDKKARRKELMRESDAAIKAINTEIADLVKAAADAAADLKRIKALYKKK